MLRYCNTFEKTMGIFSKFKKTKTFNLTKSDFKSESKDFDVLSVEISGDLFDKLPQSEKQESGLGKSTLTTNTALVNMFRNKVEIIYDPSELIIKEGDFISKINEKLNWIINNENEINNEIANKLLGLKNESWLEENESELSERKFIKKIKLVAINFFDELSSELIFDDGGLFWEHEIVVDLDTNNALTAVNIRG